VRTYTAGHERVPYERWPGLARGFRVVSDLFPLENSGDPGSLAPTSISFEYLDIESLRPDSSPSLQRFNLTLGYLGRRAAYYAKYTVRKADPGSPLAEGYDLFGVSIRCGIGEFMPTPEHVEAAIAQLHQQQTGQN
jgi:hypothetical protein